METFFYILEKLSLTLLVTLVITFTTYQIYQYSNFFSFIRRELSKTSISGLRGRYVTCFRRVFDESPTNNFDHEIADVYQFMSLVWGRITLVDGDINKSAYRRRYQFFGAIRRGILVCTYQYADYSAIDIGSFTLQIQRGVHDQDTYLEGRYAWVDDNVGGPEAGFYSWERMVGVDVAESTIHRLGLIATKEYQKSDRIAIFHGRRTGEQSPISFFLETDHYEPTGVFRFINHSCSPNCHVHGRTLFALKNIKEGEEITVNYKATEESLFAKFECKCQNSNHVL